MRLSAIRLHGFKSFRERTQIRLEANPVVIVGPNGCGKSNIVDAIRWVLGESSARQLRGAQMVDVISNGADGRATASEAMVELTFDNSAAKAPAPWTPVPEIRVGRRLSRDGDSQYRINDARCRRRDVADLFLGTGLGSNAYAIIEQGTIGRIVEARPEELRAILEEAAGVSRYKERRRESQQRIQETGEHLQRLYDLHGGLGERIAVLQRQAESARSLRALWQEQRRWRWWQLLARLKGASVAHERLCQRMSRQEEQAATLQRELAQLSRQQEGLQERRQNCSEDLRQAQEALYRLQAEESTLAQELRHEEERCRETEAALQRQRGRLHDLHEDSVRRKATAQEAEARCATIDHEEERLATELETCRAGLRQTETELEESARKLAVERERRADARREREVATARRRELASRLDALHRRIGELEPRPDSSAAAELSAAETAWAELEAQRRQQAVELAEASAALEADQEQLEARRAQHGQQRARQQELRARRQALERLQSGLLARLPTPARPGTGLLEHLRVDPPWEFAVERILGPLLGARLRAADDAVRDVDWEHPWILADTDADLGTATGSREDALLARLTIPESWRAALHQWLWGLRCASDITEAWARRHELSHDEAWITPAGQILRPQAFSPAEGSGETSLLQCRRELELVQREESVATTALEDLQRELVTLEQRVAARLQERQRCVQAERKGQQAELALRERLASLRSRVQAEQEAQRQAEANLARLRSERTTLSAELAAVDEQLEQLRRNAPTEDGEQRLRREEDALRARQAQQRSLLGRLRQQQQALALEKERLGAQRAAVEERLREWEAEEAELQRTLAHLTEDLEKRQKKLPPLKERLALLEQGRAENRKRVQAAQAELDAVEESWRLSQSEIQRRDNALRRLEQGLAAARVERETLEAQLQALAAEAAKLANELGHDPGAAPEGVSAEAELGRIEGAIAALGNVNLAAEEELREAEARSGDLAAQITDVETALAALESAMAAMDSETSARFQDTLQQANGHLQRIFATLFGGGEAELQLDGDDPLLAGLLLRARPPGKRNAHLQQLSGGEKALTALALVFALFALNPAPFCVLDEVDAPLDDANVGRFCALLTELAQQTQFLVVSHRHLTLQVAAQLLGVTMPDPGISRVVPVSVAEVLAQQARHP
jgi:chromosome segregation protein